MVFFVHTLSSCSFCVS